MMQDMQVVMKTIVMKVNGCYTQVVEVGTLVATNAQIKNSHLTRYLREAIRPCCEAVSVGYQSVCCAPTKRNVQLMPRPTLTGAFDMMEYTGSLQHGGIMGYKV